MQRDVMRAEIEGHADGPVGELLRRIDGRIRWHHQRRIADDGASAELPALDTGLLDAAVIAPFAGVVHVRLSLLEEASMARERVHPLGTFDVTLGLLLDAGFAIHPFDNETFPLEQTLIVSDQLRQTLEWCGGFQDQPSHDGSPHSQAFSSRLSANTSTTRCCATSVPRMTSTLIVCVRLAREHSRQRCLTTMPKSLRSRARSSEATLGLGVQSRRQRPFPQGIDVVLKMRRVDRPHDVRGHARMSEGEAKDELHRGNAPEQVIDSCLLPALPLHGLLPSAGWRTFGSPAPNDDARSRAGRHGDDRLVLTLHGRVWYLEHIEHTHR